ncbi:MAG TPA: nucleotide exchange factor GrpE [Caldilineaceae bacterium]|nr:nucleotide exchange factor GrpE [Caldilineaceae bacterium]
MSTESTVVEVQPEDANKPDVNQPDSDGAEGAVAAPTVEGDVVETARDEQVGEAPAEPTDAEVIEALRADLAAAEAKADDLLDKLQRTAAEFQNSRRRQEKQLADEIERASSHLIQRIFPVVDDLELAFGNLPSDLNESQSAWVDGFRQIQKKLESLLEDQGVAIVPREGAFDPNRHEAISSEPNDDVESGHIIQTLRTGYEYKGRVLRPALVRVAM